MFNHRKFTAFVMSLLICSAAFVPQTLSVYAHPEHDESSASESSDTTEESSEAEKDDIIVSGDYSYSLTPLGTACIEGYTGTDTQLVVPDKLDGVEVTKINRTAFETCEAVSIHIPAGITYISGDNPFLQCLNLKEITVDENNEEYMAEDGILYSKDKLQLLCYPQAKEGDSFEIPSGVEEIAIGALYQSKLKEISLPESVTMLSRHSISYCPELTSIDLSSTRINYIGEMAFSYCTALTEITFPDTLIEIGGGAFAGCSALTAVSFPASLTTIRQNAFAATGLTEVVIPATVTEIGYSAFGYDESLNAIEDFIIIGEANSAAHIYATDADEDYGYENNFTFKTIEQAETESSLPELESIAYGDFAYAEVNGEAYITACTSIESTIEVPSEINGLPVTCIYGGAFYQNSASEIILPDTLKKIEALAFCMCQNLTAIIIPEGVTEIGDGAFDSCSALKSITIPDTCTSLGDSLFLSCTALETATIPGSCETIGSETFLGCLSLKEISVSEAEGGNYCSDGGVLYTKDKSVLVAYPAAKTDTAYTAPDSLKEILQSAFFGCTALEEADISSVSAIGAYAFENCTSLSSVKLAENIERIDACAFYNCTALKSVRLYNVNEIGTCALGYFYDSTNEADAIVDGFKIHAEYDSDGYRYCDICGIECVTDTFNIFGFNVVKGFAYAVIGIIAAVILAVIGIFTGKSIKKKKAQKNIKASAKNSSKKLAADNEQERKDNKNEAE